MPRRLRKNDIERLENTSIATLFGEGGGDVAEDGVCGISAPNSITAVTCVGDTACADDGTTMVCDDMASLCGSDHTVADGNVRDAS